VIDALPNSPGDTRKSSPLSVHEGGIVQLFENSIGKARFVTVKELAVVLCVSEKTVRDWIWKEKVPFERMNGAIRFNPLRIAKWLAEGSNL
jgi:excisionase family DNA binding protein